MLRLQHWQLRAQTQAYMITLVVAQGILLFVIGFLIFKRQPEALRPFFWPALIFKCIAGILLGLLYFYYYTKDDTFNYFADAGTLVDMASASPSDYIRFLWVEYSSETSSVRLLIPEPRAVFFTKMVSLVCLVSGNNYWITSLYFSFISFCGAWYLFKVLSYEFKNTAFAAIALLFFPSIIFWTSGLIKESVAMATLFGVTAIFVKIYSRTKISVFEWVILLPMIWILWNLKYYFLAVYLPVASTLLVMRLLIERYIGIQNRILYLASWLIVFIIPLYVASVIHPNFYPERFLDVIVSNYDAFTALSAPEDLIHYTNLTATPGSILSHFPWAAFSALFRPFLWEAHNALQVMAALENTMIVVISIVSLTNAFKTGTLRNITRSPLVAGTLLYVFLVAAFLALSTPNFGTLCRFRVGFLPFYLLVVCSALPGINKFKFSR